LKQENQYMRKGLFFIVFTFLSIALLSQKSDPSLRGKKILLYTKNGKGYVHENIPYSIAAFQKLSSENKFSIDTTTDASVFNEDALKKYDAIIFSNTNNDVFDTEEQRVAFMRYIQAGGGFVGIHSAIGTERNWKWFKLMIGATFLRHPPFQPFIIHVIDKKNPATKNLSSSWHTNDEFYYFKEINPSIHVLTVSDLGNIKDSVDGKDARPVVFGNRYPSSWCHEFDGGKIWYTALGHSKDDYSNKVYLANIMEGLKWVLDKGPLDYKKAYATRSAVTEDELF